MLREEPTMLTKKLFHDPSRRVLDVQELAAGAPRSSGTHSLSHTPANGFGDRRG
jgi:hypothetical protein